MSGDYRSEYRRDQIEKIRDAQDQGIFVFGYSDDLPLPDVSDLKASDPGWSSNWYHYDAKLSAYVLNYGRPVPEQFKDWPKAQAVEAIVRPGQVVIVGTDIVLDMDTTAPELRYGEFVKKINTQLAHLGLCVWSYKREDDALAVCTIANESALVHASSVVYSRTDNALVAAVLVDTSTQTIKAIRASMATNRKSVLAIKGTGITAWAETARRSYLGVSATLTKVNAVGMVQAILHPLCGNPQEELSDYFYVVAAPGEDLAQKAGERLALAIPWPTRPEWTDYLLTEGKSAHLVEDLTVIGQDFVSGLRVDKSQESWHTVIAEGLRSGKIKI